MPPAKTTPTAVKPPAKRAARKTTAAAATVTDRAAKKHITGKVAAAPAPPAPPAEPYRPRQVPIRQAVRHLIALADRYGQAWRYEGTPWARSLVRLDNALTRNRPDEEIRDEIDGLPDAIRQTRSMNPPPGADGFAAALEAVLNA